MLKRTRQRRAAALHLLATGEVCRCSGGDGGGGDGGEGDVAVFNTASYT